MPEFEKSPASLVEHFDAVAAEYPDAARRMTFGYPCLYVGGNMVTGLFEAGWFVRLGAADTAELARIQGATPFSPMPGRPMTGYTVLPPAVVDDGDALREWVERAIDFGASLPPKTPKPKASKRTAPPA